MKKIVTSVIVVLSALSACTVQNQGLSYDDVYYSSKDQTAIAQVERPVLHKTTKAVVVTTDQNDLSEPLIGNDIGNNENTQDNKSVKDDGSYVEDNSMNNNFNPDDYYDYAYASRIRRFQYSYFNDYYHDFYTNRYWYDYNPGYYGMSIYSGWGMNPGMSYYMDPFNSFYSPFGYGYSPYGFGYNNGFNDYYGYGYGGGYGGGYGYGLGAGYGYGGYGYGGGYSNVLDHNSSVYHAPRRDFSSSNGPTPAERTAYNQRYNATTNGGTGVSSVNGPRNAREVNNASGVTTNSALRDKVAGSNASSNTNAQGQGNSREQLNRNQINRYIADPVTNPQANGNKPNARSFQQQQDRYFKDRSAGVPPTRAMRANGNVRYSKPQQDAAPQRYYSPANSRPRSSNEYTSPAYRNPGTYNARTVTPQRSVSNPQRYAPTRVYQSPSNNNSTPTYTSPSRSNYTAPTQTYSAPTQSYSAPSQSYSSPSSGGNARESSSGSGSGSSSGSSSGPRR